MLFRPRHTPSLAQRLRNTLWPRGGLYRAWLYAGHRMRRLAMSPHAVALGFAAGVFASFTPFVGLHLALAAALALLAGGSVLASAFGTFIGNPLTYPLIWLSTYDLGGRLLGGGGRAPADLDAAGRALELLPRDPTGVWPALWRALEPVLWPMTVGALPLGLSFGILFYFLVRWGMSRLRERRRALLGRKPAKGRAA